MTSLPAQITFHGSLSPRRGATKSLFMEYGEGGARPFLSGHFLEAELRRRLREQWMLPGDAADSDIAKQVCAGDPPDALVTLDTAPPGFASAPLGGRQAAWSHLEFEELARRTPISVIALLPRDVLYEPVRPYGRTVQQFLDRAFGLQDALITKWRHDILLVTYPTWYLDDSGRYPYDVVKQLLYAQQEGFVPIMALADICTRLEDEQWHELCATSASLVGVEDWRGLLTFCARNRDIFTESGLHLTDELRNWLRVILSPADVRRMQKAGVTALRVVSSKRVTDKHEERETRLEFEEANHAWEPYFGFSQERPLAKTAR